MITTIAKRFTFDAAHHLPTVPADHKCHRMHGHTYAVEFRFSGTTHDNGFCAGIDYDDIAKMWAKIHATLDHRELNLIPGLEVPSTENLVKWIITAVYVLDENLGDYLRSVQVAESSTTWCEGLTPIPNDWANVVRHALRLGVS